MMDRCGNGERVLTESAGGTDAGTSYSFLPQSTPSRRRRRGGQVVDHQRQLRTCVRACGCVTCVVRALLAFLVQQMIFA